MRDRPRFPLLGGTLLEVRVQRFARLGAELKARAGSLDRTDAAAVAAYNAQVEARNTLTARYDAAAAKANAQIQALEPARLAWSRDCAERAFRREDRQAIEAGR